MKLRHDTPRLERYRLPAMQLQPDDRIRDRGQLHTVTAIQRDPRFGSITLTMEDGGRLGGINPQQPITFWRTQP